MTLALTPSPVRIALIRAGVETIHVRAVSGDVRLGPEQSDLQVGSGGISITPADGIQHFDWRKPEIWMMAETAAVVEVVLS